MAASHHRRILSTLPAPWAVLAVLALLGALLAAPAAAPARAAEPTPVPATVTLIGSLQSELGCSGDWDPACAQTHLQRVGDSAVFSARFAVPAGSYELKVALNDSWDESYGKDGGSANIAITLAGDATLEFSYDHASHRIGIAPTDLPGPVTAADKALAQPSLRAPLTRERMYFVMADRFANGSTANDAGGLTGGRLETGLDPTAKGFYHGGDLKGLTGKLDYIKGLGTTAIWLTPSFKNRPVQGSGSDASAGYHGYWITDFTQVDPHLGTNADLTNLVAAAHRKGMKVFFDIITNHTADVIDYTQQQYTYIDKATKPYKDAAGNTFDDKDYAGTDTFPTLDAATSFPYTPTFRTEADKTVKVPAWLNDPTYYHNRGDSTFAGESAEYGDFVGLDDLFTEQPAVLKGMTDIYKSWVDFGIDGFRIDTVKHVNMEFWQSFSPAMQAEAKAQGNDDFFMFGEVYDARPSFMSQYTTTGKLPATLDFGFQAAAKDFALGKPTNEVRDLFAGDDYYTDTDSNAYELPTFLGNHDMGRIGYFLKAGGVSDPAEQLQRDTLAHQLMYLTRGQPVVYYGDEQGFTGAGGGNDQSARQDMFASQVAEYNDDPVVIGGTPGSKDRYLTGSPMYRAIKQVAALRQANPALADGTQVHRYASSAAGIYAFSRVDRKSKVEYLVAANNSTSAKTVEVATFGRNATFRPLLGSTKSLRTNGEQRTQITVAPLSVAVWRATRAVDRSNHAPAVYPASPQPGGVVGGRAEIGVSVPDNALAEVTFAFRPVGTSTWQRLGTDDNAPYRVFHDTSGLAKGTLVEYRSVLKDSSGRYSATSTYGVVGDPAPTGGGGGGVGPVVQPDNVSVPGDHNSEMGCAADWDPACDQAQLTLDPKDQIWKGTYTLPEAPHAYKAALNKTWDVNYGAGGVKDGPNISYTAPAGPVSFYYDQSTHYVTSDAEGPIVTAPGSFQSELGCPADWSPDCMRPWLQDPDGDGVFTWSTDQIPAGDYEVKAAHGLSWDESYGAGGSPTGANIAFTVPGAGVVTTFSYTLSSHVLTVATSRAGAAPDLSKAKAHWVSRNLIAWPATALPAGTPPEQLRWRLHWSASGGLAVDDEAVTGGESAALRYDARGLPASVVAKYPQLQGFLALRLAPATAAQAGRILRGQVAVGQYDSLGRLTDATGVQLPGVLDDLYAGAASANLGMTWRGSTPALALWAPTAQDVDLLLWRPGRTGAAPQRIQLQRSDSGVWSARGSSSWRNAQYLYDVSVYAPTTKVVEHNQVTDPYSLALTTGSARSVVADLDDAALRPNQWRSTASPTLANPVDSTIYELHVRDFSVGDQSVPAAHRGGYLAFADDGAGTEHLKALADAGLNTVHLLPTFDLTSVPEDASDRTTPNCDLPSFAPDSEQQQACVTAQAATDGYNWGYDPYHWMAPEGSYATNPNGTARVREFRTMVGALHADGLRVVLDQVYNHTSASGQAPTSVLDRIVPGYYQRLNPGTGAVETSTCCQNVATEHAMAQKLMVDSVVSWAREYKVDGFRFDLMGHASKANMLAVRHALDALTLGRDGVDGKRIYLYGEGWNFGEVANNALFYQATQGQLGGTGIGTFSDRLRDAVRGGGPFDDDPRVQGLGSGLAGDPNGAAVNGDAAQQAATLAHATDLVELGMAGNLRAYTFRDTAGDVVRGDQIDYNGNPAGYADQPAEVISYVDAHDNETLWDALTYKLPQATAMSDRIRMNTLSLATTALGQSPSFWHAGADLLRSKSLDRNSFDSGDWFNTLDWTGADNGFGHGLPPKADNEAKWPFQRPLLADAALKPTAAQVASASAAAQDLLRLRSSSRLFRLGSADLIGAKVGFPASGTPSAHPGVLVMRIDDTVGPDVDRSLRGLVVVVNATPSAVSQVVPGLSGHALALSAVQSAGSDPVVKGTSWDSTSGTATVPARTVAVLVEP
ncbi:pullulanase-type alpha-1,6-glucosidase [Angustibacter sp. McL0619]|uniref:pullulanase-type alpha-1,6-glucosidase n=1 Tax=Angustibacter sp. McL0619 TaxID=3415676 RepID=UPI003CF91F1F